MPLAQRRGRAPEGFIRPAGGHRERPAASGGLLQAVGDQNQHPGYTDVLSGDRHIADLVPEDPGQPAWSSTLISSPTTRTAASGITHAAVRAGHGEPVGTGTRRAGDPDFSVREESLRRHTRMTPGRYCDARRRFALTPLPDARAKLGDLTGALDVPQPWH